MLGARAAGRPRRPPVSRAARATRCSPKSCWPPGSTARAALPASLRDALMVRVERLEPPTQDILRVLAVGRSLRHDSLAEAADAAPSVLRAALREATEAHIIVADSAASTAFATRCSARSSHDDLLPGERAELHRPPRRGARARASTPTALTRSSPPEVAHHYLAGGRPAGGVRRRAAGRGCRRARSRLRRSGRPDRSRAGPLVTRAGGDGDLGRPTAPGCSAAPGKRASTTATTQRAEARARRGPSRRSTASASPTASSSCCACSRGRDGLLGRRPTRATTIDRGIDAAVRGRRERRARADPRLEREGVHARGRYGECLPIAREAIDVARRAGDSTVAQRLAQRARLEPRSRPERSTRASSACARRSRPRRRAGERSPVTPTSPTRCTSSGARTRRWRSLEEQHDLPRDCARRPRVRVAGAVGRRRRVGPRQLAGGARGTSARPHACRHLRRPTRSCASRRSRSPTATTTTPSCRWTASRSVVSGSREPQFIGWEGSLRAELERRRGDIPAARSAVDDALDAIEFCSEDSARIARLAHVGAQIEADAAERARDLGDESGRAARDRPCGGLRRARRGLRG